MMVIIAWTSTTTTIIIHRVCHSTIINCPVKQSNKQFPIITQKKYNIYDKSSTFKLQTFFLYIAKFQIYTPIYSFVPFSYAFSFSFRFPILEVFRMRLAAHAWRIHGKVRRRYSTDLFFSSISFDFAEFSSRSPLPFHPLPFPIRRDFAPPSSKDLPHLPRPSAFVHFILFHPQNFVYLLSTVWDLFLPLSFVSIGLFQLDRSICTTNKWKVFHFGYFISSSW